MSTLTDTLVTELAELLQPIIDGIGDPSWFEVLFVELGATSGDAGETALVTALVAIGNLKQQVESLATNPVPSFAGINNLLQSVKSVFDAVRALSAVKGPAINILGNLGEDFGDLLFGLYLSQYHPLLYATFALLAIIDYPDPDNPSAPAVGANGAARGATVLPRFHFENLPKLFTDPVGFLHAEYINNLQTIEDANAVADKLFGRVANVLKVLDVPHAYGVNPGIAGQLGDAGPLVDHSLVIYCQTVDHGAAADAGVILSISPAITGDLGLVVYPFGSLALSGQLGNWALTSDLTANVGVFAYGKHGVLISGGTSTSEVDGSISATLPTPPDGSGPAYIFGASNGSRLEVGGASLKAVIALNATKNDVRLSMGVTKVDVVILPGDGDGFLSSILPQNGLRANFDLGLSWSNTSGFAFSGSAGLDATLPVGLSIGGSVTIPSIHLGLQVSDAALLAEISAGVGVSIGPIQAVIDRVGINTALNFPSTGGNLGVADLGFSFKSPSGVGLSIDAAGISGGGFLDFDGSAHQYSGVLQLKFNDLTLQAFGLITTQVAGNSGYSLLALIDADFPPVQLGWGFTLNGVGGLMAANRTANVDALRSSLKANKISSVLFPTNAITSAPQVLAQLDALFPTAEGRFLFGPMALIGWGTPTILTAALALILELPEPIRIILIARLTAALPSQSNALVRINMDALGVLDLSQDSLALDATLFDSKFVGFTLSGDMSLRANWSGNREFLLAIGGFHPQFTPPPGFPTMQRITIDMPSGAITKMRLAAYLAITSNSLQFGANLDVFLGVAGFGLSGHLGFDALLQIDPFHFAADISGRVALTAGGDDLMSVGLDASLSGPAPWHISGSFKIHIIFFDVHKSFSFTWGNNAPVLQIPAVNVLSLLTAAFADARNWGTQLPSGTPTMVTLRSQDGSTMVVHPLAQLEAHESVVPLGLQITRYGSAAVSGLSVFELSDFTINGTSVWRQTAPVQDDFAPAQFFDLSDTDKLSGPSFEQYTAGARFVSATPTCGAAAPPKNIAYETSYIDGPGADLRSAAGAAPAPLTVADLNSTIGIGASARADIRSAGKLQFQAPGKPVSVTQQKYAIANTATLAFAGIGSAAGLSYFETKAYLTAAIAKTPSLESQLQIVALHEMAS
jgi:hypothetical protein